MKLISVILSGGAGTRLWPASRQDYPKPFLQVGISPLLQQAIERGQACGTEDLLVVTNKDYHFLTRELLAGIDTPPQTSFLLEPRGRNTAPAIALAALSCVQSHGEDAMMLVLPADHLIPDTKSFVANVLEAIRYAQTGQLVVFGITPTHPETGFGYVEVQKVDRTPQAALRFVEKPDQVTARAYLATGRYYWNSGMFCFTAKTILDALQTHSPQVLAAAKATWKSAKTNAQATHFDAQTFGLQPDISIDYAVMERASNVTLVPAKFGWSDVGSWPAVSQALQPDNAGNTLVAAKGLEHVSVDTTNSYVRVDSHTPKVVATVGVDNLVIVDTPDALLVMNKSGAQGVKLVVDALKERQHESATVSAVVHRPWGTYASLKEENGYKVKRITVQPGASLSLQSHQQRAEHWVVVQGTAKVQIGEAAYVTRSGEYRYIPLQEKHRLTNIGKDLLVLIEVQCGGYLGEDDIQRFEDVYGRS